MSIFLASDNDSITLRIRELLLQEGINTPTSSVVPLDMAPLQVAKARPELIVVVLSPDPERAIQTVRQLRARSQGYMLAVGPIPDSKLILRTIREGADEYLDEADLESEVGSALFRLTSERNLGSEEPGRIISIVGPCGGSGSSTLSVNLAAGIASTHKRCALFDMKLEAGDLAALLNLRPNRTLADLSQNADRMDPEMFEQSLTAHASGIRLLAAPQTHADLEYVTLQGVRVGLNMACDRYPFVVVDLDHNASQEQCDILQQSDLVLLPFRLEFTALRNAIRMLDYLQQLGVDRSQIQAVVNRYGQPKEVPVSKAEKVLGAPIFHYIPEDARTVNGSNNEGLPAVLKSPNSKVARALLELADKIASPGSRESAPSPTRWIRKPPRRSRAVGTGGAGGEMQLASTAAAKGEVGSAKANQSDAKWGIRQWFARNEHEAA